MARVSKFTDEQKLEIALELFSGKVSHAEVCRKWDISSTYAYKLKDRALEILRKGIGDPSGRPSGELEQLRKKVAELEHHACDQVLAILYLKKRRTHMIIKDVYSSQAISVRRLARTFQEPVSTVGQWIGPHRKGVAKERYCPVSGDPAIRACVRGLCDKPRNRTFGYRRIWALLRRNGLFINKKTVWKIMHDMSLTRPKRWYKPYRPKRVEKMRPVGPNRGRQIDMTGFGLSDLTPLYLVIVTDCYTRKIAGWTLDRRYRAGEWISALRIALESEGLRSKKDFRQLTVRSDNGSQLCSKRFVEFPGKVGVRGQYTGYNAPDDSAYVERMIRTIKEEEIWPNFYDSVSEARAAVETYVNYYNDKRKHSALDYRTPSEVAAVYNTLAAA